MIRKHLPRPIHLVVAMALATAFAAATAIFPPPAAATHSVSCQAHSLYLWKSSDGYVYLQHSSSCTGSVHSVITQGAVVVSGFPLWDGRKCTDTNWCMYRWRVGDRAGTQRFCASAHASWKSHWYSWRQTSSALRKCIDA